MPAHGGVSGLVHSYGAAFLVGHYLGAFFQSTHYAVNGVAEVLALHRLFVVARGNQCCLVAHIGNVGARKSWGLTCKHLNIHRIVKFERLHVHLEYGHTFREFGQVYMYLSVKTSGTQQR